MSIPASDLRPREFALLLLASGEAAPRKRARDQRADHIGLALKRRVLQEIEQADPAPDDLPRFLTSIIEKFGPPYGPTRSVANVIMNDWTAAQRAPEWLVQFLDASLFHQDRGGARNGQQLPG